MSDELFGVRNSVYLGAYQQAISDALSVSAASDAVRVERDFFMYRAFVEQGQYRVVMDEVTSDSAIPVQAVKQLATYLDGGRPQKDAAIAQIKEWLTSTGSGDWMLLYIAGTLLMHEDEYKEALKYTHSHTNLDVMALVVQLYIGMHRMDLARKQFESMQQAHTPYPYSHLNPHTPYPHTLARKQFESMQQAPPPPPLPLPAHPPTPTL